MCSVYFLSSDKCINLQLNKNVIDDKRLKRSNILFFYQLNDKRENGIFNIFYAEM